MSLTKKWRLPEYSKDDALRISEEFNVSLLVANVLSARGFSSKDVKSFLSADISGFHNPFLLNDMSKAVERINNALENGEKIAVYGDYDVDGITATYITYDYLRTLNADVIYYIPDRIEEGYGINNKAIDTLKNKGIKLIITVDVGITAIDEVEYAKAQGLDIIITDHHTLKETLPNAVAVINPKITASGYPFDALAGVGVAFKLIYALSGMDENIFDKYSDIAAIGTIADMVPLKGENRYIASKGIQKLRRTTNQGLKALMSVAGILLSDINSADVSFSIAPRLNAAGRISHASQSVELLLEDNPAKALESAIMLDNCNKERQQEEQIIFTEALDIIDKNNLSENNFIVVAKKGWAHGIIGIVSSKITEKFYRPSAVVSINDDGSGKASGRSIKGVNLFSALAKCEDCLVRYGGHDLAAGFTVRDEMLDEFTYKINNTVAEFMTEENKYPVINIDSFATLGDITLENAKSLSVLEPYGIENRTPVFCIENITVCSIRYTQNGKHAFVTVTKNGITKEFPAFSMADDVKKISAGDKISVAGTIGINSYKGSTNAQFVIRDIKASDDISITRHELAAVFTNIRTILKDEKIYLGNEQFLCAGGNYQFKVKSQKIRTALNIFGELDILRISPFENGYEITKGENFRKKTELSDSETFVKYNHM